MSLSAYIDAMLVWVRLSPEAGAYLIVAIAIVVFGILAFSPLIDREH